MTIESEVVCSKYLGNAKKYAVKNNTKDKAYLQKRVPRVRRSLTKDDLFKHLSEEGYFVKKRIGEGSYSKVYYGECVRIILNKYRRKMQEITPIAFKVIDKRRTSEDYITKFLPRELNVLRTTKHNHLVNINSIYELGPFVCICMDYCQYGDLLQQIQEKGALNNAYSKLYFNQICSAVYYLHLRNISHRDIKCENVLIYTPVCVKLTDFGFARRTDDVNKKNLCRTYCGSTAYAAPEVIKGVPYDPKLYDMWSLGCVLYVMVCGVMPYDDQNIPETLKKQESGYVDFPENTKINTRAKNLICCLLQPDVKKRYQIEDALEHPWMMPRSKTLSNWGSFNFSKIRIDLSARVMN